jgi:hypothetical protein
MNLLQIFRNVNRANTPRSVTSFNFAEQDITRKIVAEGCPQHLPADTKPLSVRFPAGYSLKISETVQAG